MKRLEAKKLVTGWSCGGGVDSTAIACLICMGRIPKPDYAWMVDVGYERDSTLKYVSEVIIPRLDAVGVTLHILKADRADMCNRQWKVDVARRWLRGMGVERCENWIGIAADESRRVKKSHYLWCVNRYPLVDLGMTREDCLFLLGEQGWPRPQQTACYLCPNQNDKEWRRMAKEEPHEFARACQAEESVRKVDSAVYFHRSCVPLADVFVQPMPQGAVGGLNLPG